MDRRDDTELVNIQITYVMIPMLETLLSFTFACLMNLVIKCFNVLPFVAGEKKRERGSIVNGGDHVIGPTLTLITRKQSLTYKRG